VGAASSAAGQGGICDDGREGLEKTNRSFFNVIITDIDMPVMNGLEFLRQATAHNEQLKKHFIFCTGNVRPEVSEVASSNRVPLLPKPFTIEQMFETLDKVLENSLYEGRVSFSDSISCVVLLS